MQSYNDLILTRDIETEDQILSTHFNHKKKKKLTCKSYNHHTSFFFIGINENYSIACEFI